MVVSDMSSMLAVMGLSGGELILVLGAILILFGAKKIPDFAKGLGQGIKEFKKASREVQDEIERAGRDDQRPSSPPPPTAPPAETQPTSAPTEGAGANPPSAAPKA